MEKIADADYIHKVIFCKGFEIRHLREYHDMSVPSDTVLLGEVLDNFWDMGLKLYKLKPVRFLLHQD